MNWPLFLSVFTLIFVAELPDKTALALFLLSSRGRPLAIFLGAAAAFLLQVTVAVLFGRALAFLPGGVVHLVGALLFLYFAWQTWQSRHERAEANLADSHQKSFRSLAWRAFSVIFIAEWGDLTQISTASLAANSPQHLGTIFCAATLALWSVSAVVTFVGNHSKALIKPELLHAIGAILFAGIGIYFLVEGLQEIRQLFGQ